MAVTIRRMRSGDVDELYRLLSDSAVMRYLEPPYDRAQAGAFLRRAGLAVEPLVYAIEEKDLAPNVCAVYTEKDLRGRGIAGRLLEAVCADMSRCGIDTLFLLTDYTSFYERYGWEFFCMAQGEGETEPSRMYVHYQNTAVDK